MAVSKLMRTSQAVWINFTLKEHCPLPGTVSSPSGNLCDLRLHSLCFALCSIAPENQFLVSWVTLKSYPDHSQNVPGSLLPTSKISMRQQLNFLPSNPTICPTSLHLYPPLTSSQWSSPSPWNPLVFAPKCKV